MKQVTRGPLIALLAAAALLLVGARDATADGCKPDGRTCRTSHSCCSGRCVKRVGARFGNCCTLTTCAAQGKDCGTVSDGCGGMLDCGSCPAPDTCGGGGTPNVCGACGGFGEPCCLGNNPFEECADPAAACIFGTCDICGFLGHPCCPGGGPCHSFPFTHCVGGFCTENTSTTTLPGSPSGAFVDLSDRPEAGVTDGLGRTLPRSMQRRRSSD